VPKLVHVTLGCRSLPIPVPPPPLHLSPPLLVTDCNSKSTPFFSWSIPLFWCVDNSSRVDVHPVHRQHHISSPGSSFPACRGGGGGSLDAMQVITWSIGVGPCPSPSLSPIRLPITERATAPAHHCSINQLRDTPSRLFFHPLPSVACRQEYHRLKDPTRQLPPRPPPGQPASPRPCQSWPSWT
jgi:hypothetical protein